MVDARNVDVHMGGAGKDSVGYGDVEVVCRGCTKVDLVSVG